jgi:hypothetical protein
MAATLDNNVLIVNVGLDGPAVTRQGFGTLLIAGPNASFDGGALTQTFEDIASVTDGTGLTTSDPEYLAAAVAFGTGISQVKIGVLPDRVAQVDTWTIGTAAAGAWVLTIGDESYPYTAGGGDNAAAIAAGLRALVDGDVDAVVNDGGSGAAIALTAKIAGRGFASSLTFPAGGAATKVATTANVDLATGLNAIVAQDFDWFGLALTSRAAEDNLQAAAWAQSAQRLFAAQTSDADARAVGDGDIASQLESMGYDRTLIGNHKLNTAWYAVGLMADRLQADPDTQSTTWANVPITGVPADTISATEKATLLGKNVNVFLPLKGIPVSWGGRLVNGKYVDERIIADWLRVRLEEDFAQAMIDASARREKIPYDESGFAVYEGILRQRYTQGVEVKHFLANSLVVTIPNLSAIPDSDKANRIFRFSARCKLAGAVHTIQINVATTN